MELFMAIVPMKFSETIYTLPRMGAVFYNDCMYLAHNTTLITHAYQAALTKDDLSSVGFVDMIPRLRTLGEACIMKHIDQQKGIFAEIVSRMNIDPRSETSYGTESPSNGDRSPLLTGVFLSIIF